ncbi:LIPB1 protein, partial [Atractosteus spatula]|nr:LIPB1 protein [Atractosteus spatula]
GSKALEYSNGIFDCQSPTSPFMGSLRALQLIEDLRGLLELMEMEEKEGLRCQIPDSTAELIVEWLQGHVTNGHISVSGDVYQERLSRLESDKESLVLQVSVLTDQVEAQGEKIRDLDLCLEEHREKLNATEEMLQQELLSRTALETQKLDLMAEVSNLKLKLTAMEKDRLDFDERFRDSEGLIQEINELRFRVTEMENERLQYEKKLKSTKSLMAKLSSLKIKVGQMQYEKQRMEHKFQTHKDELLMLQEQLEQKEVELKRLREEDLVKTPGEGPDKEEKDENFKKKLKEKLTNTRIAVLLGAVCNNILHSCLTLDRKIEELRQSLNRYKKVQDMVISAQVKKDKLKEGDSEESQSDSSVSVSTAISVAVESDKSPSPVAHEEPGARQEVAVLPVPGELPGKLHTSVLQVSISASTSTPKSSCVPEQNAALEQKEQDRVVTPDVSQIQETSICDSPVSPDFTKSSSLDNLKSSDADKKNVIPSVHQTPQEMAENFLLLIKVGACVVLSVPVKGAVVAINCVKRKNSAPLPHISTDHGRAGFESKCMTPALVLVELCAARPRGRHVDSVVLLCHSFKNKAFEEISKFGSLPPKSPRQAGSVDDSFGTRKSFGRGFFKIKGSKRTASTPNLAIKLIGRLFTVALRKIKSLLCVYMLWTCEDRSRSASAPTLAETEREGAEHLDLAGVPRRSAETDSSHTSPSSPESRKKARGIKKLFGKLKRSQSTTFNPDDMSEPEFKRGGVRATAGPRLGWSRDLQNANSELDTPFAKWTKEQVCNWLQEQGLGLHVGSAKQWILSGQTLLQASQQDLERELGIKHPLHRKKLQLALQALGSEEDDNKGKLDYNWVTRWLDDIGLPQYKTQFDEGRVDGRMLHYMTVDDLLSLKVGSVLHHLSIKRAIQVLRINNYEPNCLRRRPSDENNVTPAEVSQWTNHRVMEWLRSVDLAEYAPNLRGSGVHGGLMVLEPRFNVETMALLLNIPPNKTLLRRHLATHFNLLIGSEAQQQKQEAMESPDYVILTATAKVKPRKLAFGSFGSLRRKRPEESEEYVCPMDVAMPRGISFQKGYKRGMDMRLYDDDLDRLEQMEDSEGTVRQIGAFSEGINNLTSMLKEDEFFKELSTCSPSASITDEDSNV